MSEWVTLSSDSAATSPHSAVWLHEGEIQASDANPVSPSSQDPSSPRRGGLVCVTCHSQLHTKNVSLKSSLGGRGPQFVSVARGIFIWMFFNVAARKPLVRSQKVELRSKEVPVFI